MIWFYWISGLLLAAIWLVPTLQLALHFSEIADLTRPEREAPPDAQLPSLTIVVPARNEEAEIEPALRSLLQLNYPQFEVIAINDRSTDQTGPIIDRLAAEPAAQGKLRVLHVRELPPGWLGKLHAMWLGLARTKTPRRETPRSRATVTGFSLQMPIASLTPIPCAARCITRSRPASITLCFFPPPT